MTKRGRSRNLARCSTPPDPISRSEAAAIALAAGAVLFLSFADGGFFPSAWPPAAAAFAAAAALAALFGGVAVSRAEAGFVAALAAFAAWQALSAAWSFEPSDSLREAERGLVYVAAASAFVLVGRSLPLGVLLGASAVSAYSLGRRVIEGPAEVPFQGTVLNEPLGYANALGLLAALALVVALGLARSRRDLVALAAPVAVSVATLALTSSRGSWLAAVLGVATVAVFRATTSARLRATWLGLQALFLAAILLSPLAINPVTLESRLSDRPYYWWTAWHAIPDHPVLGWGAGTFDAIWGARAPIPGMVRDAHSVYLETLVELGPVGLVLLIVALGIPAVVAASSRHPAVPAGAGAYAAFLFHAGIDWDWEMPAVTVAGLACGAAVLWAERRSGRAPAST